MEQQIRLQKFLADSGVCSRRAAEKLIEQGSVKVGGRTAFIGDKVPSNCTTVTVDGKRIYPRKKECSYFMLYKPRGYVTTSKDELSRKCVTDIMSKERVRLYPVGRLDKDSEGLLIMTNDGDLANKMMHPKNRIPKTYRAIVTGDVNADVLHKLTTGVYLEQLDYTTASAEVDVHSVKDDRTVLLITIYEGKNRQIRRMCEACELEVLRLKRERIGKLSIGTLKAGQYRKLSEKEISYLKNL